MFGLAIFATEIQKQVNTAAFLSFLQDPKHKKGLIDWPKVAKCIGQAIGADLVYAITPALYGKSWKQVGKTISKKGLKKIALKLGSRFVGPFGIGIILADFAYCMGMFPCQ